MVPDDRVAKWSIRRLDWRIPDDGPAKTSCNEYVSDEYPQRCHEGNDDRVPDHHIWDFPSSWGIVDSGERIAVPVGIQRQ
jgi:hypothetical protein